MTSAFEQAAQQAAAAAQPAQYNQPQTYTPPPADAGSNLIDPQPEKSQLFGGAVLPSSLLNKTHGLGTERHGRITVPPKDTHSRDYTTKQPKYWAVSPVTGPNGRPSKITTNPVDHITGEKLRPVLDTVIELDTDYRFDAAECAAIGRDPNLPDDGSRAFYASGDDIKQLKAEIRRIGGITSEADMVGLTLSVTRAGQKPNPGGAMPSWINKITLSR